jgi:O-antigen/teichoic acid export membrane protein
VRNLALLLSTPRALLRDHRQRATLVAFAGAYAGAAGLQKLVGFVLFMWLARSLSVQEYAGFGLAYALQTGVTTLALSGIVESAVGLLKQNPSPSQQRALLAAANGAFLWLTVPAILLAVLCYVGLTPASSHDWFTIGTVVVSGVLLAFASVQAQIVRLQEDHLASMLFNFVAPLSGFIAGGLAFLVGRTVTAFFAGMTVGLVAGVLGLRATGIGFYERPTDAALTRRVLGGIGPFLGIAALGWLSGYGNNYLVRLLFNSTEVARFTFALMVSSLMQLIASALNQVWSPRFFRLVRELPHDDVEYRNRIFYRWQAVALGLAGGAVLALFRPAITAVGGQATAYRSMGPELLCLIAAYVVLSPFWHCYNYYLVHGEGLEAMHLTTITSVIGIAAWLMLMWFVGPIGVYAGFLLQMLLRVIAVVWFARRRWSLSIAWDGVAAGLALTAAGFALSTL